VERAGYRFVKERDVWLNGCPPRSDSRVDVQFKGTYLVYTGDLVTPLLLVGTTRRTRRTPRTPRNLFRHDRVP
jgi:hypothetical protein